MNKSFQTYDELINQKQKLEVLLHAQKELIRADVEELKLEVRPLSGVAAQVKKFTTRDKASLFLAVTSDAIATLLVKKIIVARSGWLGKLVLPHLMRNYSSNFLKEQKDKFFHRIASILKHKNGNEQRKKKKDKDGSEYD
jgi:hypothetical protein